MNVTTHYRQIGFIGDSLDDVYLGLFTDADFAGDRRDSKSTSGVFVALMGPNTFHPIGATSKKQTVCSHSTVEAEIVAAYTAVRLTGIPMLDIWETVLGRTPDMYLFEDNQATSRIVSTGKYPTLRHVRRMHGVSISWLHDAYQKGVFQFFDCTTEYEAADIFTKHFTDVRKWRHSLDLIGIVHEKGLLSHLTACLVGTGGCTISVASADSHNPVGVRNSADNQISKPPVAARVREEGKERKKKRRKPQSAMPTVGTRMSSS